jgi:hypothetical protein
VYGDPKIPAPDASARVVVDVVMLIADSAATATESDVVPFAANCAKQGAAAAKNKSRCVLFFIEILK